MRIYKNRFAFTYLYIFFSAGDIPTSIGACNKSYTYDLCTEESSRPWHQTSQTCQSQWPSNRWSVGKGPARSMARKNVAQIGRWRQSFCIIMLLHPTTSHCIPLSHWIIANPPKKFSYGYRGFLSYGGSPRSSKSGMPMSQDWNQR